MQLDLILGPLYGVPRKCPPKDGRAAGITDFLTAIEPNLRDDPDSDCRLLLAQVLELDVIHRNGVAFVLAGES
jgi:hypothetical protein